MQLDDKQNPKPFAIKKVVQMEEYEQNSKDRKLEWIK